MSKKSKSEVEMMGSGAALLSTFWSLFTKEVTELGGTAEDLRRLTKPEGAPLIADFAKRLVEASKTSAKTEFQTWKTIKLGTRKSAGLLREALEAAKFRIGDWASDLLNQKTFTIASEERELELVQVTVAELGFPEGATRKEIYEAALAAGLNLCPPEVGPQLCLQYPDQSLNEWMQIGMDPIAYSDGNLHVFSVGHNDDGRWLHSNSGNPGSRWDADDRWVFARSK